MSIIASLRSCPPGDVDALHAEPERILPYLCNEDPDAPPPPPPPGLLARLFGARPQPPPPPRQVVPPDTADLDLDKAWHGLHYLLTGSGEPTESPLSFLMAGGMLLGGEQWDVGYGPARAFRPDEVAVIASALADLGPDPAATRYDPAAMQRLDVYPGIWDRADEDLEGWLGASMAELRTFVAGAAARQQALLVWMS